MSSLGKRSAGGYGANKRARAGSVSYPRTSMAKSGRYNRRFGTRRMPLQRAPGVSGETGFLDVASASYALDTTGSVTLLNTVPQGTSVNQRVGKKMNLKSLQFRGNLGANSAALVNDVAFMIVYDKRPTGALPAVTDILAFANSNAMNNDANSGRFVFMKRHDDILIGNTSAAASFTDSAVKACDYFLNLKGMPTVYKAAGTGAIGDIEQGALYLVTVGNNAAGTSAASKTGTFRLRFQDA